MKKFLLKTTTALFLFFAFLFFVGGQAALAEFGSWEECKAAKCQNCEHKYTVWVCLDPPPPPPPPAPGPGTVHNPLIPGLSPASPEQAIGQLGSLLRTIISTLIIIAAVAFFFMFLIGAIKWIVSSGDKVQVESARNTIVSALVGLVIVLSLFAILKLIETIFGFDILQINIGALKIK